MTVLLRSFIVWLMLLALPYQGYASAQMLLCVVPASAPVTMQMPAGPHDHAAMLAQQAHDQHKPADAGHTAMKCSGSACCSAAAPLLMPELVAPALPLATRFTPFYSEFLPAVDLAHPERPPQGAHA